MFVHQNQAGSKKSDRAIKNARIQTVFRNHTSTLWEIVLYHVITQCCVRCSYVKDLPDQNVAWISHENRDRNYYIGLKLSLPKTTLFGRLSVTKRCRLR